jgi:very-short-patch-repair endonuclease
MRLVVHGMPGAKSRCVYRAETRGMTISTIEPARLIRANGGVLPYRALARSGVSRGALLHAIGGGAVFVVRRGWYAVTDAPPAVVRAVRVGGALTGASVARLHGLWTLDDKKLHVRVPGSASRLRSPLDGSVPIDPEHDVCVHYRERPGGPNDQPARDSLARALAEMFTCGSSIAAMIAVDSALNLRELSNSGRAELRALVPASKRRLIDDADPGCESGLETIARMLPRGKRLPHRTQAYIPGVGRVDLLIGDRLVVELDGAGFHMDKDDFAEDRRRGFELVMRGYLVVRLTYGMVVDDWDRVRDDLLALIARGEHHWGVRARAWAR